MHPSDQPAAHDQGSAAETFALLWSALDDMMGSAATAALLRRAARRGEGRAPELSDLVVRRERFEYSYDVPASWRRKRGESLEVLLAELSPLLEELTGSIVLRRLRGIPQLQRHFLKEAVS